MDAYTLTKRRNLLITSLLLFLISFSGIELGHDLSISSIKFSIKETTVIYMMLWGMYGYFFIRFFHCLIDEENKDANDARDLLSLFSPPLYELTSYNSFGGYMSKIWHFFTFMLRYIEQLVFFTMKSLFGKSFLEYLFPILFALFVGTASYYSPFMESKKEATTKLIDNFWCSTKHKSYDMLLPDYLKRFETFNVDCNNKTNSIGIEE